jgi:hypothetical protein
MSSTVWAVPATRVRDTYILRFLKEARCSVRVAEVRLFKTGRPLDQAPEDRRRWEPGGDLPERRRGRCRALVQQFWRTQREPDRSRRSGMAVRQNRNCGQCFAVNSNGVGA